VGLVSFLFGSGIVVKPEFEQLSLLDAARHSYTLSLTDAEGRAVDLAFEVPAKAQGLVLADGDARVPLGPLLGARGSAPN
jgi:hypothetical protein